MNTPFRSWRYAWRLNFKILGWSCSSPSRANWPGTWGTISATISSPVLGALGIPPETAALLLVRPVSGSGALAVGSQLMEQYGPDSAVGRTAAVMLGCSETTFYTVAVYFGAAGIRRTRYTIPAALTADLAAFIAAAWAVRLCFGGE